MEEQPKGWTTNGLPAFLELLAVHASACFLESVEEQPEGWTTNGLGALLELLVVHASAWFLGWL
jgi:hypothetical protein